MYLHATSSYMEEVFGEDHALPLSMVEFPTVKDVSTPPNGWFPFFDISSEELIFYQNVTTKLQYQIIRPIFIVPLVFLLFLKNMLQFFEQILWFLDWIIDLLCVWLRISSGIPSLAFLIRFLLF